MKATADDKHLIDRILYLASLVSEPQRVDTTLDKLRMITASSRRLTSQDLKSLESVESDLENYLVTEERLRSFTKDSLRANVEHYFAAADPVREAKRAALRQISLTITAAIVVTVALAALGVMHGQVILAFLVCALFAALSILYQSYKKDLVSHLHGSMTYLMAGTVGTGLFALNFPLVAAIPYLRHLPLMQHGGFLVGAVPVYAFYYIAFYFYAKQLGTVIPKALRPWGVVIIAAFIAAAGSVIPHPVAVPDEFFYHLAVAGFAVSVYLSAVAAALGFMTLPQTTEIYSKSTLFLAVSMVFQTLGNGNFLVFVTFPSGDFDVNDQKGQILTALIIIMALVSQYIAAYKSKTALRS